MQALQYKAMTQRLYMFTAEKLDTRLGRDRNADPPLHFYKRRELAKGRRDTE